MDLCNHLLLNQNTIRPNCDYMISNEEEAFTFCFDKFWVFYTLEDGV